MARLPYDMGNAGDLLKHGVLAEFTDYWLSKHAGDADYHFRFYDPFGGRVCEQPPNAQVVRRIKILEDCALKRAQGDINRCYYGSSSIVNRILKLKRSDGQILVSDRDSAAMSELSSAGFQPITIEAFQPADGFTILDCKLPAGVDSLVLLDPYADFMSGDTENVLIKLGNFIQSNNVCVALFTLTRNNVHPTMQRYGRLKQSEFDTSVLWLSLACPQMPLSTVRGEQNYRSEILLIIPLTISGTDLEQLRQRLGSYARKLAKVLPVPIDFAESRSVTKWLNISAEDLVV